MIWVWPVPCGLSVVLHSTGTAVCRSPEHMPPERAVDALMPEGVAEPGCSALSPIAFWQQCLWHTTPHHTTPHHTTPHHTTPHHTTPHHTTPHHTTPHHTLSTPQLYSRAGCRVRSPRRQGPGTANRRCTNSVGCAHVPVPSTIPRDPAAPSTGRPGPGNGQRPSVEDG